MNSKYLYQSPQKNAFLWMLKGILCLLLLGCSRTILVPQQQALFNIPHHHEVLRGTLIDRKLRETGLVKKASFIAFLPMELMAAGNRIEQQKFSETLAMLFLAHQADEQQEQSPISYPQKTQQPPAFDCSKSAQKLKAANTPYMKITRIRELSFQNCSELLKQIVPFMNHPDEFVRLEAIRALHGYKDKKMLPHLYQTLKDSSALVRAESISVLQKMGYRESVSYLWQTLKDPEVYVRQQGTKALEALTGESVDYPFQDGKKSDWEQKIETWKRLYQQNNSHID